MSGGSPSRFAAVRTAARGAERFAEKVADLQRAWTKAAGVPRRDSAASALIASLPAHPILDVRTAQDIAGVSNESARLTMIRLEEAAVLKRINAGKRNRAWEAVGLFELLNEFERDLATSQGSARARRPKPR